MGFCGHKRQWEFLQRMVVSGKIPQAIIFEGMEGIGKKMVALELAKLLACSGVVKQKPCGRCQSCSQIDKEQFADVILVKPIKKEIQIDQIREIQKQVSLKPQSAQWQVVIIDTADSLNQQAGNAFLKTLEEPKGDVIFILITSHPEKLLPTIRSRCWTIKFYPLALAEIASYFQNKIQQNQLAELVQIASGQVGLICDWQNEKIRLAFLQTLQEVKRCLESSLAFNFIYLKDLLPKENAQMVAVSFLDNLILFLRNLMLSQLKINQSNNFFQFNLKKEYSLGRISLSIQKAQEIKDVITKTNVSCKMALENLFLNL